MYLRGFYYKNNKRRYIIKNLIFLIIFIAPPLLLATWHINRITIKESFLNSENPIFLSFNRNDSDKNNFSFEDDKIFNNFTSKIKNISRYYPLINIQPDIIRHSIFVKNLLSFKIPQSYNNETKEYTYTPDIYPILICDEEIKHSENKKIKDSIRIDENYIESLINNCLINPSFNIKNDFDFDVKIIEGKILVEGDLFLLIKPDFYSKIIIYLAWYIFCFGFFILIEKGPGKHLLNLFNSK